MGNLEATFTDENNQVQKVEKNIVEIEEQKQQELNLLNEGHFNNEDLEFKSKIH